MKKLICVVLILVMLLAMTGCDAKETGIYRAAVIAYEMGMYKAASSALGSLENFEDAQILLATIHAKKVSGTQSLKLNDPSTLEDESELEDVPPIVANIEFVYDGNNLIKETLTYEDGTVTKNYYKYDELGNCTSETINHTDGTKTILSHHYDGYIKLRTIRTNPNGSKETFEYEHDEFGRIVFHQAMLSDGTIEKAVYTYNDKGLLASIARNTSEITTYKYNYFGHLTKEILTTFGFHHSITTYTYQYEYIVQ